MENGPFIDDLAIKMVIFHSYVSLPKGNRKVPLHVCCFLFLNSLQLHIPISAVELKKSGTEYVQFLGGSHPLLMLKSLADGHKKSAISVDDCSINGNFRILKWRYSTI